MWTPHAVRYVRPPVDEVSPLQATSPTSAGAVSARVAFWLALLGFVGGFTLAAAVVWVAAYFSDPYFRDPSTLIAGGACLIVVGALGAVYVGLLRSAEWRALDRAPLRARGRPAAIAALAVGIALTLLFIAVTVSDWSNPVGVEVVLAGELVVLVAQVGAVIGLARRAQFGRVLAGTAFVWWAVTVVGLIPAVIFLRLLWTAPRETHGQARPA